jgi:cobalt-zinc-cadmium resistance protein CzcA
VAAAIGGTSPGDLYEPHTDRHFPIMVRLKPEQRDSLEAVKQITVGATAPDGSAISVPLSELANIRLTTGASFIYREHQSRYIPIKFSVRDRDLGSAVAEAQDKIAKHVVLPQGYSLEWAGELANLTNAVQRLEIVVPISLLVILGLLYANFRSMRDTLLAFSVIPMAIVGGVLGLLLTGTPFSISAAIGFVALFGIAVMDGILVVTNFNQAMDEGLGREKALRLATTNSLRPVVMTCLVAAIGPCRRRFDRDRQPGAKAAGACRRGRHDHGSDPDPVGAAAPDQSLLQPFGKDGKRTGEEPGHRPLPTEEGEPA